IASITLVLGLLVGVALISAPDAIGAILGRGAAKAGIAWSSTWALAGSTPVPVAVLAAIWAVSAFAALMALRAERQSRRVLATVAIAAALSLIVTPYAQPYDFLLALPALSLAALSASERRPP